MASAAPTLVGSFDTTHGLNLAVTQGFFGRFYYLHDARLSALWQLLTPYTQQWHELIPSWPATKSAANQMLDEPSSGVFIAAASVGQFMSDAHTNPELQVALANEFPGEKLHVLWAALTDAYESGQALLEASGVIEPDPHDITRSVCRTNQTNCDEAGLRLYFATARAAVSFAPASPLVRAAAVSAPPPDASWARPPIANPQTVALMDWEAVVLLLGHAHNARAELVSGPGGFLEIWEDDDGGLMSLVHPAFRLGMALWFDWAEDYLLEERCRAMADWRIGWPDEGLGGMDEHQFSWDGSESRGKVDEGLEAFDRWLQERGRGMRLVSVQTYGDFYVSFLYPVADAYQFIEALGRAGVEATMQDGSLPAMPKTIASAAPPRRMPGAPSLAERMRERANNPEPPSDI